jgi:hypothetical protein
MRSRHSSKEQSMTMKKTVAVFAELLKGPATRYDLADKTASNPKSVGRILNEMKAHKMIYVIGYTPDGDGRNRLKVYSMGDGEDAKPLRVTTQEQRSRKSYLKKVQRQKARAIKTTFVGGKGLWT